MMQLKTETRSYVCLACGYIYDEQLGYPDGNILLGTRWEDIPLTWCCPECGVLKEDFSIV